MSLIPKSKRQVASYNPFKEFFGVDHPFAGLSLFSPFERELESLNAAFVPAIDISEDKNNIIVKADLPGVEKKHISVSIDNNVLTIRGERKSEVEKKENDYQRVERSYGYFKRQLSLGTAVDQSKVKATYKNGVLELTLPKTEQSATHDIPIEG